MPKITARNMCRKIAVITGGAEGIGYEIADKFLSRGLQLAYLLDVNSDLGNKAVENLTNKHGSDRVKFTKCDVTKDLKPVTARIFNSHYVDILVNNANLLGHEEAKKTIDLNVTSTIQWGLEFWEHMRQDKDGNGGTIINLASIYDFKVNPFLPLYQATKYAVIGFTKSLGHPSNYQKTGVRVVALCPGFNDPKEVTDESKIWNQSQNADFVKHVKAHVWQKPGLVGEAALEVFENADSGTSWLIGGDKPIIEDSH